MRKTSDKWIEKENEFEERARKSRARKHLGFCAVVICVEWLFKFTIIRGWINGVF